ncbi:MAG TPA: efflux RND transporter periplasmic adaptor subunit [bacterium]|nr:efflux RND transporter periplasmic adaptor subunit [bacterium]
MIKRFILFVVAVGALVTFLFYQQQIKEPLKVSGFIEADEIRVGSRVGGRVHEVSAEEGRRVSVGDVLVKLEPFDLLERRAEAQSKLSAAQAECEKRKAGFREEEIAQAQARRDQLAARLQKLEVGPRKQEIAAAQARLDLANAQLELAELNYKRVETLLKQQTVSREDMDKAETERKVARATVQVRSEELTLLQEGTRIEDIAEAKAQLEEASQAWQLCVNGYRAEDIAQAEATVEAASAALRVIDRQLEELTITAPVEGVIEAVELQPGDLVAPNAPVISIMDTSHLWVRAYVPENRLNIRVDQKVPISVDSYPGETFAAHISFIARQAEFTPGNVQTPEDRSQQVFRIKVTIDEGLDRARPGMVTDVWLESRESPE